MRYLHFCRNAIIHHSFDRGDIVKARYFYILNLPKPKLNGEKQLVAKPFSLTFN